MLGTDDKLSQKTSCERMLVLTFLLVKLRSLFLKSLSFHNNVNLMICINACLALKFAPFYVWHSKSLPVSSTFMP